MKNATLSGNMPKRNVIGRFVEKRRIDIIHSISGLLILLFLYTGANKFFSFEKFTEQMNNQVFPNSLTPFIVWMTPSIEILIAIGLMFDKTRKPALYGSLVLMSLFTIYTGLVLFNAFSRVPCACGGVISQLTWKQHFVFNLFFVMISLIGIKLIKNSLTKSK